MFKKYVDLLEKKKTFFVVFLVLINLLAFFGLLKVKINPDFAILMPDSSNAKQLYDEMNERFNAGDQLIYMLSLEDNPDNIESLFDLRKIQLGLENIPGVNFVSGPAPEYIFSGIRTIKFENLKENELNYYKNYIESLGKLRPITSKDGQYYAIFTLFTSSDSQDDVIMDIENYLRTQEREFYGTGETYIQNKLISYLMRILLLLPPISFLLVFFVFRYQMSSRKGTILAVLPAAIGALWTLGIMGWIGKEISIITIMSPIFTIVMGSADGLHFMSHYLDKVENDLEKETAVAHTLKEVGIPMIMTTLTTIAGFLSLIVGSLPSMVEMAIFASIGIGLAGISTWLFLPMVLINTRKFKKRKGQSHILVSGWLKKIWGKPSFLIAICVIIIALPGIASLKTEFNQLSVFKKDTEVYESFEKIMEVNDGALPIFIELETAVDPLAKSLSEIIMEKENELLETGMVVKAISVYDLMSTFNKQIYSLDQPEYPKNNAIVNLIYNLALNQENSPVENFLLRDEKISRMMVFPKDLNDNTLEAIEEIIRSWNTDAMKLTPIGLPFIMKEVNDSIIKSQTRSLIAALAIVLLMLLWTYKNVKLAFFAIIPIGLTLGVQFSFMGYIGMTLNVITATMASITIGVGIDYAIHFVSLYQLHLREGSGPSEAVERAFASSARPIIANALGLSVGMSALFFSPLMIHTYLAGIMWITMIASSFLTLAVLPSILLRKASKRSR